MNSDNMPDNFASSNEVQYGSHVITLVSEKVSYENNIGKFIMQYATPNTKSKAFNKTLPKQSTRNVINNKTLGKVSRITSSNYVNIEIPKHLFYITNIELDGNSGECNIDVKIKRNEFLKGQKFIAINAGGSVEYPMIVGVL